jgi:hypothetical protein
MNLRGRYILPVLGWSILAATAVAKSDLSTPEQRHESIDQAKALIQPVAPAPLPTNLKNPFVLSRDEKSTVVSKQIAGDREVLEAAAHKIIPSGVVQFGGDLILLLGEKRLKVGDYLPITLNDGTEYMVEIAAISHSSFTLRLNKEKITQPINP